MYFGPFGPPGRHEKIETKAHTINHIFNTDWTFASSIYRIHAGKRPPSPPPPGSTFRARHLRIKKNVSAEKGVVWYWHFLCYGVIELEKSVRWGVFASNATVMWVVSYLAIRKRAHHHRVDTNASCYRPPHPNACQHDTRSSGLSDNSISEGRNVYIMFGGSPPASDVVLLGDAQKPVSTRMTGIEFPRWSTPFAC